MSLVVYVFSTNKSVLVHTFERWTTAWMHACEWISWTQLCLELRGALNSVGTRLMTERTTEIEIFAAILTFICHVARLCCWLLCLHARFTFQFVVAVDVAKEAGVAVCRYAKVDHLTNLRNCRYQFVTVRNGGKQAAQHRNFQQNRLRGLVQHIRPECHRLKWSRSRGYQNF